MNETLLPAARAELSLLANLFQLYAYDFSEVLPLAVGADGRFPAPALETYWSDPGRDPFLLRVDDHPAGFALIHHGSRISGDPQVVDMAEFFVLRRYRRHGVGTRAALALFGRFRGRWEVRQLPANASASRFWRAVIAAHTGGRYTEEVYDDERWRGPVQTFDNR